MTKFVQEALVQYPTDQYPTTIQINNTLLAAATYNGNLHLNDKLTLKHRAVLPSNNIIKQIKLSDDSAWVCYNKQKAILWDIRTNKIDLEISSDYPLSCIDVKQNMLVLGSDLHGDDAFLCFYDIRVATQIMYRFDEMHSDDITQVHIHPNLTQVMISGSTDGLINLYDLSLLPEGQDECLYQVIKTDSVSKLNYFGPEYEYIASISHMETFSIYKFDQGELVKSYGDCRNGADYLIDSYYDPQCQELSLIGGTREGAVCLFDVQIDGLQLVATINGGHDDIITDCHVEPGRIISAGEDGKICSWVIDN